MTRLALLALAALFVLLGPVLVTAQAAPPVDRDTACGQPATGYRSDGSKTPQAVTLDAAAAAGLRVGPDGYWRWCEAPTKPEPATPAPCLAEPVLRTWGAGGACVGQRDRLIPHGGSDVWVVQDGATRGMLVEACTDGKRRVVLETCAPAVECDNEARITRDGVDYVFDARPAGQRVPLGATVQARAADGSAWPVQCVAGSWVASASKPASAPAAPTTTRLGGCAGQTFAARVGLQPLTYWRYTGPRVAAGQVVRVSTGDGATAEAVCQPTGRLELRP